MSTENDKASADDGGRNGLSIIDSLAAYDGGAAGYEPDDDVHCCGRCRLQFTNIDDFIKHKLQHGDCRLQYKRSGHLRLPKLVKKQQAEVDTQLAREYDHELATGKRKRGRPRKVKAPADSCSSTAVCSDGVVVQSIAAEEAVLPEHKCTACGKGFHRKAALKCHLLQEHGVGSDAGSDVDEDYGDEELDGEGDDDWSEESGHELFSARLRVSGIAEAAISGAGGTADASARRRKTTATANEEDADATSTRRYTCTKCAKTFREVNVLKTHMLTHTEDRAYPCTVEDCHFAFKTKGSLKRHLRRHTDERPYKCNKCKRAFRESGALTRHLKSRTPCLNKSDSDLPRYGKSLSLSSGAARGGRPGGNSGSYDSSTSQLMLVSSSLQPHEMDADASANLSSCQRSGDFSGGGFGNGEVDEEFNATDVQKCCLVCKMAYEDVEELMEHLRSHLVQQQQPVRCDLCGHTAATGDALDEHVAQQHSQELDAKAAEDALNGGVDDDGIGEENEDNDDEVDEDKSDEGDTDNAGEDKENDCESDGMEGIKEVGEALNGGNIAQGDVDITAVSRGDVAAMCTVLPLQLQQHHMQCDLEKEAERETAPDCVEKDEAHTKRVRDSTTAVRQLLQLSVALSVANSTSAADPGGAGDQADGEAGCHQRLAAASVAIGVAQRTCPVCSRTFKAGSYLRLHMRSHTGERPHKCPHCPKDFATKDTFNKHMLAHSDERQYKCGECGKLFKRISHVKEHLKIHSSERPYPCSACEKSFKTSNAWKVHMRTHSQVMAWQCKICRRQFREKSSLIRHARTHTGERPYACKFCGRHFSEHGTLNRHLRAKVPCTTQLSQLRLMQQGLGEDIMADLATTTPDGFPTVLTEFSSVVADTQQYITADAGSLKALEQCVVVENIGNGSSLEEGLHILSKPAAGVSSRGHTSLPTFYVVKTSNSDLRVHYSSDDQLFHPGGPYDGTETVVMLQSPTSGAETVVMLSNAQPLEQQHEDIVHTSGDDHVPDGSGVDIEEESVNVDDTSADVTACGRNEEELVQDEQEAVS